MEVFAISDLHVGFPTNFEALKSIERHRNAGLILAGDIGETADQLGATLDALLERFGSIVWCPGNHELWSIGQNARVGVAKYDELVAVCRSRGVLTPEDEFDVWTIGDERLLIVPMFLLYDYTFAPDYVKPADAVAWAAESGIRCVDEDLLLPDPYASRAAWCAERCRYTAERIARARGATGLRTILINHFPLKQQLARLPAIPRFRIWCGTRRTEDWSKRFDAAVAISGHLHIRTTTQIDGCRFEEVSLGYPRQWNQSRGISSYLKRIDPTPWAQGGSIVRATTSK